MSFLSDLFSDPGQSLTDAWNTMTQIPGSPEAVSQSVYNGVNGDASWNPYSPEASVWDQGALGSNLSEDPKQRAAGRMVGTAIGSYFTGGLLGSYLGQAGGAAANGALWSGAQAAGTDQDVGKAMMRGGASGYLSSMTPNVAGAVGVDSPVAAGAINGGVRGAGNAYLNNQSVGRGALMGAGQGAYGAYGAPPDELQGTLGGTMQDSSGESSATLGSINSAQADANSTLPLGTQRALSSSYGESGVTGQTGLGDMTQATQPAQDSSWLSPELGAFMGKILPQSKEGWGDMAQGLMGLYAANKQRRMARDLRNQMGGNRSAYGTQLQRELQRRDAAAGRRSNYGGRAVELQSSLAKLDSQNAPAMAQLQQAELGGLMNMFQTGLRYGGKSGWFGDRNNPNVPQQPGYSLNNPSMESYKNPMPMDQNSFDPYRRFRIDGGGA